MCECHHYDKQQQHHHSHRLVVVCGLCFCKVLLPLLNLLVGLCEKSQQQQGRVSHSPLQVTCNESTCVLLSSSTMIVSVPLSALS